MMYICIKANLSKSYIYLYIYIYIYIYDLLKFALR